MQRAQEWVILALRARVRVHAESSPGAMDLLSPLGPKASGLTAVPAFEATVSPTPPLALFPRSSDRESKGRETMSLKSVSPSWVAKGDALKTKALGNERMGCQSQTS